MRTRRNTYEFPYPPIESPAPSSNHSKPSATPAPKTPMKRDVQRKTSSNTLNQTTAHHGLPTPEKSTPAKPMPSTHQMKTILSLPITPKSSSNAAGNSDLPYRQVENFLVRGGRTVLITGESNAMNEFLTFVHEGKYRVFAPGVAQDAMLQALEASLQNVHHGKDVPAPTVEQLQAMLQDKNFDNVVDALSGRAFVACSTSPDVLRALLHVAGQKVNEVYRLGQVTFDPMLQGYRVQLDETIPQIAVTNTVWLQNDHPHGSSNVSGANRWYGFGSEDVTERIEKLKLAKNSDKEPVATTDVDEGLSKTVIYIGGAAEETVGRHHNVEISVASHEALSIANNDEDRSKRAWDGDGIVDASDETVKMSHTADVKLLAADENEDLTKIVFYDAGAVMETTNRDQIINTSNVFSKRLQRNGVPGAPPQDTDLPWSAMGEITSDEILTFFPNHALHWPAVSARLIEDGWTISAIADYINTNHRACAARSRVSSEGSEFVSWTRGSNREDNADAASTGNQTARITSQDHTSTVAYETIKVEPIDRTTDVVVNSTILASICKACGSFYSVPHWRCKSWQTTMAERSDEDIAEAIEKMRKTEWKRLRHPRQPLQQLKPSWSLKKLGEYFLSSLGRFPCDGNFTKKVAAAADSYDSSSKTAMQSMKGSNPPRLPNGWQPAQYIASLQSTANPTPAKRPRDSEEVQPTQQTKKFQLRLTGRAPQVTRGLLPPSIRDDADAIINEYPNLIADELLLWILSANGGRKTIVEVLSALNQRAQEEYNANPAAYEKAPTVDRSTISYRKRTALQNRAKVNGTSYNYEFAAFETQLYRSQGHDISRQLQRSGTQVFGTRSGPVVSNQSPLASTVSNSNYNGVAGAYSSVDANGVNIKNGVAANSRRGDLGGPPNHIFDDIPEGYAPAVGSPLYDFSPVSPLNGEYQMNQELINQLVAYNQSHPADPASSLASTGEAMLIEPSFDATLQEDASTNDETANESSMDTRMHDSLPPGYEMMKGSSQDVIMLDSGGNSNQELLDARSHRHVPRSEPAVPGAVDVRTVDYDQFLDG